MLRNWGRRNMKDAETEVVVEVQEEKGEENGEEMRRRRRRGEEEEERPLRGPLLLLRSGQS